jgi:Rieske Fe-S protein
MKSRGGCSRRRFLHVIAATSAGAYIGCAQDGLDTLTEDFEVVLSEHSKLAQEGKSVLIDAGLMQPISVTRTGPEEFVVTGTECAHQHCGVTRDGDGWLCPCHGSRFALEGDLEAGPAKEGLTVYDWMLDGDVLTIFAP